MTVPQHRLTPVKNSWMTLYTPVTENMKLDMRMNLKAKKVICRCHFLHCWACTEHTVVLQVELKTNPDTPDSGNVQKAADFIQAFILGRSAFAGTCTSHIFDLLVAFCSTHFVQHNH